MDPSGGRIPAQSGLIRNVLEDSSRINFLGEIETPTKFSVHKIWVSRPIREGEGGKEKEGFEVFQRISTVSRRVGVGDPNFVDRKFCGRLDFAEV